MHSCPLCATALNVRLHDVKMFLYRCLACDHTFVVKPKEKFEVYEEKYYLEKHANWFKNPNYGFFRWIHGVLKKHGKAGRQRVLDVGYGNGDFLKYLAKNEPSFELHGIDSLKVDHPGVNFMQGDFFTHPMPGKFDAVTTLMVIEHVPDPKLFVQKLNEYLEPGGVLVLSTNNDGGLFYAITRFLKSVGMRLAFDRIYSDHHLQHFTNRSLGSLLRREGFEVLELRNHNYPLAAVDTPPAGPLVKKFYLSVVWGIFAVSSVLGNGFLQTFVCRKKAS